MAGGRPCDYTYELGLEICDAIATSDKGLKALCKANPHWPVRENILKWRNRIEQFRHMYEEAKKSQVEALVDECLDIADDTSLDDVVTDRGISCNSEWISRSRVRIDTRKWLASKLAPRIYGDKQETNNTHNVIVAEVKQNDEIRKQFEKPY